MQLTASQRKYLALVVLLLTGGFSTVSAPRHGTLEFFSTAAQIIPVLLLLIVVEVRLLDLRAYVAADGNLWDRAFNYFLALLVVLTVIVGEFSALRALAHGNADYGSAKLVYQALALGFGAVVLLGIGAPLRSSQAER